MDAVFFLYNPSLLNGVVDSMDIYVHMYQVVMLFAVLPAFVITTGLLLFWILFREKRPINKIQKCESQLKILAETLKVANLVKHKHMKCTKR